MAALIAVVSVGVVMAAGPAAAGSAAADLAVSGTVANNCLIATTGLNFSAYDPIVTNKTLALDVAAGKVTITCTQGTVATIGLGIGLNAPGTATTRAMIAGGNKLSYEIYQETGRTTVWTNTGAGLITTLAAPDALARDYITYGRVPAGQAVPSGEYMDTVVATVNF
jgi:spore coat protein U-like protein